MVSVAIRYSRSTTSAPAAAIGGGDFFHAVELIYIHPFGEADSTSDGEPDNLEVGMEAFFTPSHLAAHVDTLGSAGYQPCQWLSNETETRTGTVAVYANYLYHLGSFSAKAGLRGELYSGRVHYADAPQQDFSHTDPTLVPSLHLTYSTPGQTLFSLSYTRRMNAPDTRDYSPRRIYRLDDYSTGNPLLRCGSSHNLEIRCDRYFEGLGSLGVNLFYSALTDQQSTLTDVAFEDAVFHRLVTFQQPVNIGSAYNGGADLQAVYRPNANLNLRFNGSLFYDYLDLLHGDSHYRQGLWCYMLRLNVWVKLWDKVQLFGNGYYHSAKQSLYSQIQPRSGLDIGLNADLCHHKLSLNLCINDLFNTNDWNTTSANPSLPGYANTHFFGRYASFGLTLRFGQMELEKEPRRTMKRK